MNYPDDFRGVLPQDEPAPIEYPNNRYLEGEPDRDGWVRASLDKGEFDRIIQSIQILGGAAKRLTKAGELQFVEDIFAEFISTLRDDAFDVMLAEADETIEAMEATE